MDGDDSVEDSSGSAVGAFERLFQDVYLRFHRRDGRRSELSGASRAVLMHLSLTGPSSIGETAVHLDRAQSVVSEIVSRLERHGLVEREPDPDNRRRVLVWLTAAGMDRLRHDNEVLSHELLEGAMAAITPAQRRGLIAGLRALLDNADAGRSDHGGRRLPNDERSGRERSGHEPSGHERSGQGGQR